MAPTIGGALNDENVWLRARRCIDSFTDATDLDPDFCGWTGLPRAVDPGFERRGRRRRKEPYCTRPVLGNEGEGGFEGTTPVYEANTYW